MSPQVNKNGELCKQMKKSSAWNPITNDLWGGLACTGRFKYKSAKNPQDCVFRQMWWGKLREDFGSKEAWAEG